MFTSVYSLIAVTGIVILTIWSFVLLVTQFFKEYNAGSIAERVMVIIKLLFMYTKQALLSGFGVMALAFSTEVFQENSIDTWIVTFAIFGFSGLMFYYFYPQFVDFDEPETKRK